MCQFMRQQSPALSRTRCVLVRANHDVVPDGEGIGAEGTARFGGAVIRMDSDLAKILIEPRLKKLPFTARQRLTSTVPQRIYLRLISFRLMLVIRAANSHAGFRG
jgi:hypothetical protein